MLFALMVVSPVTLLHGDGDGLSDTACRADLHRDGSRLVSASDSGHEHAVEEMHVRFGEALQRGSVAIADALEGASPRDLDVDVIGSVGTEVAVFVGQCHGDVAQIVAVSKERVFVSSEAQSGRVTGGMHSLFPGGFSVFVIDDHLELTGLVGHAVPHQTVAREEAVGDLLAHLLDEFPSGRRHRHASRLMTSALALAVDEELSLVVVGVAHHRCHLAFASWPSPVGQQMDGVVVAVPYRAVEIVAVLGQSGEVADAEIAAARRLSGRLLHEQYSVS